MTTQRHEEDFLRRIDTMEDDRDDRWIVAARWPEPGRCGHRFYLAARYSSRAFAAAFADRLEIETGGQWSCCARWLHGDPAGGDREIALADLEDVLSADALVVYGPPSSRGGMWIEAGIALGAGLPVLRVAWTPPGGGAETPSPDPVFMSLPEVFRVTSANASDHLFALGVSAAQIPSWREQLETDFHAALNDPPPTIAADLARAGLLNDVGGGGALDSELLPLVAASLDAGRTTR